MFPDQESNHDLLVRRLMLNRATLAGHAAGFNRETGPGGRPLLCPSLHITKLCPSPWAAQTPLAASTPGSLAPATHPLHSLLRGALLTSSESLERGADDLCLTTLELGLRQSLHSEPHCIATSPFWKGWPKSRECV
uniref:Uncharacterized protein n=1 Tax=Pipistrellus kuhlii TaxID=59472 RepID=A0A7J7YY29_PIPKU|nr:hypothetical protein mPipKuh1_009938 [Pipistrellus kuhlii]